MIGTTSVTCDVPDEVWGDVIVTDSYAEGVGSLIQAESVTHSRFGVLRDHTIDVDASVILVDNEGTIARVARNMIEDGTGVVNDNCAEPDPAFCLDGASAFGVLAEGPTTKSRIVDNDLTGHFAFETDVPLAPDTSMNEVKRNAGAAVVDLGSVRRFEDRNHLVDQLLVAALAHARRPPVSSTPSAA